MVARNALAVTGMNRARVLDCPAIPDGITNLPVFLGTILAAVLLFGALLPRTMASPAWRPALASTKTTLHVAPAPAGLVTMSMPTTCPNFS